MNKFLIVLTTVFFVSCAKEPMGTTQTDNSNFEVGLLFVHDGCKVYRFYDAGHYKYFTNCTEAISEETHSCGKNCITTKTETIGRGKQK